MNPNSSSDVESNIVEEHVLWSVFVRTHLIAGVISAATLMYSFFSLFVWRQGIHAIQLVLFLVGLGGLVYFCVSLFTLVTYFRYDGERLTVRRFGRRQRHITPLDITLVRSDNLGSVSSLWLRDGSTFQFCFKSLPKAHSVIESLKRQMRNESLLEGHINVLALAKVAAPNVVPSTIGVLVLTIFALMGVLAQRQAIGNGGPLGWILVATMFFPLAFVYIAIQNRWGQVVVYYNWDGKTIRLRKVGSRRVREYSISDIESIFSTHENAPTIESGIVFWITMKDRVRFKILTAFIPNGREVVESIQQHFNRAATVPVYSFRAQTIEQVDDMKRLKPYLQEDEDVLWVGRPKPRAALDRVLAEILFGLILIVMGSIFAALGLLAFMRGGDGIWIAAVVGLCFVGVGLYNWTAPWRYQHLFSKTLYAVTDRRALILNGVIWDNRGGVTPNEAACDVIDGDDLVRFEVSRRDNGIRLGSFYIPDRKKLLWCYRGFWAPKDQVGAIQALKWGISLRDKKHGEAFSRKSGG